jgi:hypothetical protein
MLAITLHQLAMLTPILGILLCKNLFLVSGANSLA